MVREGFTERRGARPQSEEISRVAIGEERERERERKRERERREFILKKIQS